MLKVKNLFGPKIGMVRLWAVLFFGLSIAAGSGAITWWDQAMMETIQRIIPRSWDTFLSYFSLIGSFEVLTVVLFFLLWKKERITQLVVIGAYFFGQVVELGMKMWIFHPNPPAGFFRYNLPVLPVSSHVQTGHSYPSGHSYRTVFLAVFMASLAWRSARLNKIQKSFGLLLLGLFCIIMLISRVSLGEHWPSDVMGGMLLGLICGWFLPKTGKNPNQIISTPATELL